MNTSVVKKLLLYYMELSFISLQICSTLSPTNRQNMSWNLVERRVCLEWINRVSIVSTERYALDQEITN